MQSRVDIYPHLVWATRHRQSLLEGELERQAHRLIGAEAQRANLQVLAIGGTEDHIHLLVRAGARMDLSHAMNQMKGVSSHALNEQLPGRPFGWQDGYAALSVSPNHVQRVICYIQRQKEHHNVGECHREWEPEG